MLPCKEKNKRRSNIIWRSTPEKVLLDKKEATLLVPESQEKEQVKWVEKSHETWKMLHES